MSICTFETCTNKHDSHGYCANHARQYRKYGHPLSVEEKHKNLSEAQKLKKPTLGKSWKVKDTTRMRGRHPKSEFKKGHKPWNEGKSDWMSVEHKANLIKANTGRPAWNSGEKFPERQNEGNHMWAGEKVSYRSLHKWVERHLGKPSTCTDCGRSGLTGRKIHWSNISGKYHRDLCDWQGLCAKCHGAYDKQLRIARIGG